MTTITIYHDDGRLLGSFNSYWTAAAEILSCDGKLYEVRQNTASRFEVWQSPHSTAWMGGAGELRHITGVGIEFDSEDEAYRAVVARADLFGFSVYDDVPDEA